MLKNMKIRGKLFFLVALALASISALLAIGIIQINTLSSVTKKTYETVTTPLIHVGDAAPLLHRMRIFISYATIADNQEEVLEAEARAHEFYIGYKESITAYYSMLSEFEFIAEEATAITNLYDGLPTVEGYLNQAFAYAKNNQFEQARDVLRIDLQDYYEKVIHPNMDELKNQNDTQAYNSYIAAENQARLSSSAILILSGISLILLCGFAYLIIRSITRPVNQLVNLARDVSRGNLNVNVVVGSKDELGILSSEFLSMISVLKRLIDDLKILSDAHEAGNVEARLDCTVFEGSYREIAEGADGMVQDYVSLINELLECLRQFDDGNFNAPIKEYPGKKAELNKVVESLRGNLKSVNSEISFLVNAALEGELQTRADASAFKGDWKNLIVGLNNVLEAISTPIYECMNTMSRLAEGNFSENVNGSYKGDFDKMKQSLNNTIANISDYIKEISEVLTEISNNNFNVEIQRTYVGEFTNIKRSVSTIVEKLNRVISEINDATQQVSSGSKLISDSSMSLAEGASLQASSVEELNASINMLTEETLNNAQRAKEASNLSAKSKESTQTGHNEMKKMLSSMKGIEDASTNISKIIKVIEDIAFQTNLLALNAAVEAARAGEHGKGFAVVAEEVRNLAARSQTAAQETTALIEDSISKVNTGMGIASLTSEALDEIIESINNVTGLINEITDSSSQQAEGISQISIGINNISDVVQQNSSTSEETASAAEELASQAIVLENMVSQFKLKG